MSGKSLQPFDVTSHIRDKVREVLVAAIPDEQMDEMIEREFDAFFARKSVSVHGTRTEPSKFSRVVEHAVEQEIKERLKTWMSKNFEMKWGKYGGPDKLTGEMVEKFIPIAQSKMMSDMVQQAMANIQSSLRML
jgi:hypothetical protein